MSDFLKKYVSNQSSYFSCKDEDNIRLLETANRLLQYSKKKTIKNIPKRNNCLNLSFDILFLFNPIYKNKQPNIKIYSKLYKMFFVLI